MELLVAREIEGLECGNLDAGETWSVQRTRRRNYDAKDPMAGILVLCSERNCLCAIQRCASAGERPPSGETRLLHNRFVYCGVQLRHVLSLLLQLAFHH